VKLVREPTVILAGLAVNPDIIKVPEPETTAK
jgi:hypothetical protein